MSFIKSFKNILLGKPVFETGQPDPTKQSTSSEQIKVFIEKTDSRINGDRFDTYSDVRNDSSVEVLLDKIRIGSIKRELDTTLKAGERRQLTVYSGPLFTNTAANDAELQYRAPDGSYYIARHDVSFKAHGSSYVIEQFRYENTSRL